MTSCGVLSEVAVAVRVENTKFPLNLTYVEGYTEGLPCHVTRN